MLLKASWEDASQETGGAGHIKLKQKTLKSLITKLYNPKDVFNRA